jgi:WD40 repeat protein
MRLTMILKRILVAVMMAAGLYSAGRCYPGPGAEGHEPEHRLTAELVRTFEHYHRGTFSADGKLVGLQSKRYFDLVELATGKQIRRIEPNCNEITSCDMSPDGTRVAVSYSRLVGSKKPYTIEDWLTLYDLTNGQTISELAHDKPGSFSGEVWFSPDGKLLASTVTGVAQTFDIKTGKEVRQYLPPARPVDIAPQRILFSPDSKWLAVYFYLWQTPTSQYSAVHLWNLESGENKILRVASLPIRAWAFSSDSRKLAIVDAVEVGASNQHEATKIFDVETLRLLVLVDLKLLGVPESLAFSPNGEFMAQGGSKVVRLISVRTGDEAGQIDFFGQGPRSPSYVSTLFDIICCVQFSPDGREILTGINGGQVRLWRIQEQ